MTTQGRRLKSPALCRCVRDRDCGYGTLSAATREIDTPHISSGGERCDATSWCVKSRCGDCRAAEATIAGRVASRVRAGNMGRGGEMPERKELIISSGDQLLQTTTRRRFLGLLAMGGSVLMLPTVFTACGDDDSITDPFTDPSRYRLDLSNDTGILNYAYALEQLEAAFYTAGLTAPGFAALSAAEKEVLQDLQKHEVIHREFLKQVLGVAALPDVGFNATTVAAKTASRDVLLSTSQLLEDTGVAAYNGAGKYLT